MATKQTEATHTATIHSTYGHRERRRIASHVIGVVIDGPLIRAVDVPPRKGAPQIRHRQPDHYQWHLSTGKRAMLSRRNKWQELELSSLMTI